ncbi:MAG: hypothetical protein DSZ06_04370 [Sulfurospirillum sp.]|nr:MAG: hypothetical protein DSZ06_04370 [Sulfurospirillum sp.]
MKIFIIFLTLSVLFFSGCGVGSLVAVPFKVAGSIVNVVTPDAVGDTISAVGDAADSAIPF